MIYIVPIGGLGNAFSVLSSVYELRKDGFSDIAVYWNPNEYQPLIYEEIFANYAVPVIKHLPQNYVRCNSKSQTVAKEDFEKINQEHDEVVFPTCYCFYRYSTTDFWKDIKFQDTYLESVMQTLPQCENRVGVHIRRGDFVTEGRKLSEVNSFIEIMNREIESDKDVKFFLATDDVEIENVMIKEYGSDRITTHPKRKGYDRSSPEYTKDGLIDMLCLANCNNIIGSVGSSFSIVASQMNSTNLKFA